MRAAVRNGKKINKGESVGFPQAAVTAKQTGQ